MLRNILFCFFLGLFSIILCDLGYASGQEMSLNGAWEIGLHRNYKDTVQVPGIHTDPTEINKGVLWYKKEVELPRGDWKYATLVLNGARFAPTVFVDFEKVSFSTGGMAPTRHLLNHPKVKPGNKVLLEIALLPLSALKDKDASYIPVADQWRSNVASCLWDDVEIHFSNEVMVNKVLPFVRFDDKIVDFQVDIYNFEDGMPGNTRAKLIILDMNNQVVIEKEQNLDGISTVIPVQYNDKLNSWHPDHPVLYQLQLELFANGKKSDHYTMPLGIKKFEVRDKQFYLNNKPCKLRAGTVVWHRWARTAEGRELGYDTLWFKRNIIDRLKAHGANALRFHLGNPPERFLDLCDKHGLIVQYEWSFFHGVPAAKSSLILQWGQWMDEAVKHPSVSIIHPYNESEGAEARTADQVIRHVLSKYPGMVLSGRDVDHIHKYWWSLFENLGLYYDSYQQFPKAIMVDEFGGNYLDGEGDPGGYPAVEGAFERFLGKHHGREERLGHQAMANAKVAEYWRRIGAAGFSPFTILGSHEDGNHWFLGKLEDGKPKPVWEELTAAWSPVSVSLDIWNRNFSPGDEISIPLHCFNDTESKRELEILLLVANDKRIPFRKERKIVSLDAYSKKVVQADFTLPLDEGEYYLSAVLLNPPAHVKYSIGSNWKIHVTEPVVPAMVKEASIFVPAFEKALISFARQMGLNYSHEITRDTELALLSDSSFRLLELQDEQFTGLTRKLMKNGAGLLLLDAGPAFPGVSYPVDEVDLRFLQQKPSVEDSLTLDVELMNGLKIRFTRFSEPESHIHPVGKGDSLWNNLNKSFTWLWNGYRGGLIVPAIDMQLSGLNKESLLKYWGQKGANVDLITKGPYFAYELEGFYNFGLVKDDDSIKNQLKKKVRAAILDAPSLGKSVNPDGTITVIDLGVAFKESEGSLVKSLEPIVACGHHLLRHPVYKVRFEGSDGEMIISQLLTDGRLDKSSICTRPYELCYDPAAVQFVLNLMDNLLNE